MLTRSKSRKELPPNPSHHSTLEHNGAPIVEPPVYDKNDIAFMNKCSSSINKIECFDNTRFRPSHMGGGDMHMKRCCRPLVRPHWPKLKDGTVPNIDGKVTVAIRHMPLYPGLYAK